jgi:AmmeMemoRadiSam system protein A
MPYSADERRAMLQLARASIGRALGQEMPNPKRLDAASLQEPRGVFVTLRRLGELRGCIGFVDPRLPLQEAICEVAVKAATEDPRFAPLNRSEFADVELEISILSPLLPVRSPQDIQVGTHGVMIDAGYTRGLLLPQVATEYGWNREEFLEHTCLKAGLSASRWKGPDLRIYTFTTETFSDKDLTHQHEHAGS